MRKATTMLTLLLAMGAMPGAAFAAQGTYQVRNASQTPMLCALEVSRGGARYLGTLRPGQTFRQTLDDDRPRTLSCSTNRFTRTNFRLRAGVTYELTETSSGALRLRIVSQP